MNVNWGFGSGLYQMGDKERKEGFWGRDGRAKLYFF